MTSGDFVVQKILNAYFVIVTFLNYGLPVTLQIWKTLSLPFVVSFKLRYSDTQVQALLIPANLESLNPAGYLTDIIHHLPDRRNSHPIHSEMARIKEMVKNDPLINRNE